MDASGKRFKWQKKARPLILALEHRMLFDGAAAIVVADTTPGSENPSSNSPLDTDNNLPEDTAQAGGSESLQAAETVDSIKNIYLIDTSGESSPNLVEPQIALSIISNVFEITDSLTQSKNEAERLVSEILARPDAREVLFTLFGGGEIGSVPTAEWAASFDVLISKLNDGSDNSIHVELRTNEEMHGAKGAFAATGINGAPTIYLNYDWLVGSNVSGIAEADVDSITRVLVEELGHYIDNQLNGTRDTPGDEGEKFSRYLIDGTDILSLSYLIEDSDSDQLILDGQTIAVELASYSFVNAYEMVYDLDNSSYGKSIITDSDISVTERWADKEQNLHYFNTAALGGGVFSDGSGSLNFSGNDVSGALAVTIKGETYYGWISRPIKANGIVRGFYFWTDADFTSLAAAQADGNQDMDSADVSGNSGLYGSKDTDPGVLDNRGFLLVVDQTWFNTQIASTGQTYNISNFKDGDLNGVSDSTTVTVANVGSSSDRVDASLNYLVQANSAPVVVADTSLTAGAVAAKESGYTYSSGNQIVTGTNGSGNVLSNDTDASPLSVTKIGTSATSQVDVLPGTTSSDGTSVVGRYGTLTIGSNGTYVYVVDNANPTVNAMQVGSSITDQFTYTVSDGNGGLASTTVTVTINGTDDAPVAVNDFNSAKEHTAAPDTGYDATGNVLPNDTDIDTGDTKSIVGIQQVGYVDAGTVISNTSESLVRFDGGSGFNSSTVTGRTLYYSIGGVYRAVHGSDDALVTAIGATQISGTVYDVKLSQDVYYYYDASSQKISLSLKELNGSNVGFKSSTNEVETTSSMKTATLSMTTAIGTYTVDLPVGGLSGSLAVGAKVWYDSDASAAINYVDSLLTVTEIIYNADGLPIQVKLDGRIPFATGTSLKFVSTLATGQTFNGLYGTLNLASNGDYTYTPYTNMTSLNAGDSVVEVFDYTMQDSQFVQSSAKLYITVYGDGTNSPLAVGDVGVAYESGVGRNSSSPYDISSDHNLSFLGLSATGNVISGGTPDSFGSLGTTGEVTSYSLADGSGITSAGTALVGAYGTLNIAADGTYTYELANNIDAVNSLNVGQTLTEVFWYTLTNSVGLTSKTTLTITINGTNDAPVAVADTGATLVEDKVNSTSGNVLLNDTDIDFVDTKNVSAVIAGNAEPTSIVSAGSTSVSGGTSVDGIYGRLVIGADGSYTYTLGVTSSQAAAVQLLGPASHQTETFTYKIVDTNLATSTTTLTFTVDGMGEGPTNIINGDAISNTSSSVFTTALNTAIQFSGSKQLSVADPDGDLASVTLSVEHGTLSFSGGTSAAVQGSTVTITGTQAEINAALAYLKYTPTTGYYGSDFLTIASKDATNLWDSDGILINIANPSDGTAQTYIGPTVYESDLSSGTTPSGAGESSSTTLTAPSTQSFGSSNQSGVTDYGSWSLNAATGVFTYTLVDAPTVVGSSTIDSVQVISYKTDGTITTNTVNISIVDDSPIANADARSIPNTSGLISGNVITGSGSATEDTSGADTNIAVVGVAATDTGVNLIDATKVGTNITGSYGLLKISSDGTYTYALDTSNSSVSNLASGSFLTDVYTYTVQDADGDLSHATFTITINGPVSVSATLTIGDAAIEEGSAVSFNATLDSASPYAEVFTLSAALGTAESTDFASDKTTWSIVYTDGSGSHTINPASDGSFTLPAGVSSFTIKIPTTSDNVYEGSETFTLSMTASSSYITTTDTATGTITDDGTGVDGDDSGTSVDNDKPTLTIGDATMEEGSTLSFAATLSNASESAEVFTLSAALGTAESTDFASDKTTWSIVYTDGSGSHTINPASDGSFTLPAGVSSFTIKIPTTSDNVYEGSETFTLSMTASSSYITTTDTATGTITDDGTGVDGDDSGTSVDNDKPTLTIGDATMEEGSTLSFAATLSNASESAEVFTLSAALGTAESTDFASDKTTWSIVYTDGSGSHTINPASDGSFTLPAGVSSFTIKIPTTSDNVYEGSETFTLSMTASSSYITTTDTATGTITDDGTGVDGDDSGTSVDNDKPTLTIGDATMEEGSTLSFAATLSNASESAEVFTLSAALGTAESTDFASDKTTWSIVYTDGSGSHTINPASDGSFTLPAGVSSFTIKIPTTSDNVYEGSETFTLSMTASSSYITTTDTATGTITDDGTGVDGDDSGTSVDNDKPTLTIGDATMEEGSTLSFAATLSNASESAEVFTLSAALGTAESTDFASDKTTWSIVYTDGSGSHTINPASDGSFTLPAGVSSFTIKIPTTSDNVYEGSETFTLSMTASSSYITTTDTATGTITDDGTGVDGDDSGTSVDNDKPTLTIGDATMEEGSTLSFAATLSNASESAEVFTLSAALGTAESTDFASDKTTWSIVYTDGSGSHTINPASDGSFTLPAGVSSFTIKIPTTSDNVYEGSETFTLSMTASSSYITTTDTATGTITDDGTGVDGDDSGTSVDNDKPTLTIGDATMEEGSTLSFAATLSNASESAEVFTLSAALGTAESTDFASDKTTWSIVYTDGSGSHTINPASDGSFTLPAGVSSFTIKIPTTSDNVYEGSETFTLSMTASSSYITTTDTATGTITDDGTGVDGDDSGTSVDNDKPTLTIGDATMEEGSTLSFAATLSNASESAEVFTLSAALGTAESTDFASDKTTWSIVYTDGSGSHTINPASDGSFTLPAGVSSFTIKIPTTSDNVYEGSETFTLSMTASSSYITTTDTATGTITDDGTGVDGDDSGTSVDNDKPTLTIGDATMEEGSTLSFAATLSNASESAEVFTLSAALGTAESTDFASDKTTWSIVYTDGSGSHTINPASDGSFTLPAGVSSFTIKIPTTSDNVYEGSETFTLSMTASSSYITTTDTATGTITDDGTGVDGDDSGTSVDNDKPTLTIGDATMEEGSTLSFAATLSNASESAEVFTLSAALGTAESTDFASDKTTWSIVYTDGSGSHTINPASDGSFTLPAGVSSFTIKIPTTSDNVYEGSETFTLSMTASSSYITTTDTATGTITDDGTGVDGDDSGTSVDNDKPTLTIGDATMEEGSTLSFAATLSNASESAEVFTLSAALGTAESTDFASDKTTWSIVYTDGSGSHTINPASDGSFTLPAGVSSFTIKIPTTSDNVYEGSETFTLSMTASSSYITTTDTATGTITDDGTGVDGDDSGTSVDNDKPTLTIGDATMEEGSTLSFAATLSNASESAEVFTLSAALGTAESTDFASDKTTWSIVYTDGSGSHTINPASDGSFTLPAGVSSFTIKIPTTSDNVYEGSETFTLSMTASSSYITTTDTATGTITDDGTGVDGDDSGTSVDNDKPTLTIGDATMEEGSTLSFAATLSNASESAEVFTLSAALGTAESTDFASDKTTWSIVYTDGSGSHTINPASDGSFTLPAGVSSFTIKIPTTSDNVYEGSETFTLSMTASSSYITTTDTATGTITDDGTGVDGDDSGTSVDNDKPTLTIGDATMEEGSTLSFAATLSNASESAEVFTLSAALGTAESTDFASDKTTWSIVYTDGSGSHTINPASDGSFTLPAGVSSFTIKIPTTSDNVYEGSETFTLSMTASSSYITTTDTATGTITDDGTGVDGDDSGTSVDNDKPTLTIGDLEVNEGSPYALFTVSGAAGQLVSLTLSVGTANASIDYIASTDYSTDGGATWTNYTTGNVALSSAGSMLVRVPILQDITNEPDETFMLIAMNTDGTSTMGTATIVDDGNGKVFNPNGTENFIAARDDDRSLRIENITVNEGSPYGVFRVKGETGQQIQLALENAGSGSGFATVGTDTGTQLQVFDGVAWQNYTPGSFVTYPAGSTTLLVRVSINNDTPYEGTETFFLKGTVPAQGITSFGTGTIGDDGTGAIYNESGAQDFKAPKDDDRALKVDSIRVNEGSDYGIFTVSLVDTSSGITLDLIQETATLVPSAGADTGYLAGVPIQYYNGTTWVNYTGEFVLGDTAMGKTLLVRTGIVNDTTKEGAETFQLRVVQGSYGAAIGIATILDDGTGVKYTGIVTGAKTPETSTQDLDDDFDKDGIAPNVEEILATMSASTGNGGLNGDLNGDGKQDSEQNSLATLAWITNDQFNAALDGTLTQVKPIITLGVVGSGNVADDSSYQLEAISVLPPTTEETGGAKPVGVLAPWDAIRFTVAPIGDALADIDPTRNGIQIRIYIDISRSGATVNDFNGYMKYVSQDTINAGGVVDLDGKPITEAGWYDFTQRQDASGNYVGDGARFVIENGKIVGIFLTITDNAFGDNDPTANRILDPGLPVFVDPIEVIPADPVIDAPQFPGIAWYQPMAYEWNWYDIEYPDIKISYVITGEYATPEYFRAPSFTNTSLKGPWPLETASPDSVDRWREQVGLRASTTDVFKDKEVNERDLPLKNAFTPPNVIVAEGSTLNYALPNGTFVGGQGPINLVATLKDGSPLPAWMKFDSATGKLTAEVPAGLKQTLEIRIQATDSKGQKAETKLKLQPKQNPVAGFEGKRSLSAQIEEVVLMRA